MWNNSLFSSRGCRYVLLIISSPCMEVSLQRLLIFGQLVVSYISCILAVSFLKEKMSKIYLPAVNFRMNVIDSIEHFCVDMLEFPDYIPIDAVVSSGY